MILFHSPRRRVSQTERYASKGPSEVAAQFGNDSLSHGQRVTASTQALWSPLHPLLSSLFSFGTALICLSLTLLFIHWVYLLSTSKGGDTGGGVHISCCRMPVQLGLRPGHTVRIYTGCRELIYVIIHRMEELSMGFQPKGLSRQDQIPAPRLCPWVRMVVLVSGTISTLLLVPFWGWLAIVRPICKGSDLKNICKKRCAVKMKMRTEITWKLRGEKRDVSLVWNSLLLTWQGHLGLGGQILKLSSPCSNPSSVTCSPVTLCISISLSTNRAASQGCVRAGC